MKNGDKPITAIFNSEGFISQSGAVLPSASNIDMIGLTKREYFAAMAMQGLIAMHADPQCSNPDKDFISERSVQFADALLAELDKSL